MIPAMLLSSLEDRAGVPACKLFDLIAGTSTGGILALGLTVPNSDGEPAHSAADLLKLYEEQGSKIFSRSVWHRITAVENVFEEKYPAKGLEEVFERFFGGTELKDALTNVLVTSYETELRTPFLFKSHRAKADPTRNFPMKASARATSAAPTYFEPARLTSAPTDPLNYYSLIDGGVYANNPAMCAFVEAKTMFGDRDDFLMVSLGTGENVPSLPYEEVKGWGLAKWARPLLGVVFDGVSDTVDYQLQQLLPDRDGAQRYFRFQAHLQEASEAMDDVSPRNMRDLKIDAANMIAHASSELDKLVPLLKQDAHHRA
jgi:patatin-like phospholipase/acyl hydrolase